jgi:ATP-binding cassette subfamily F protein 2
MDSIDALAVAIKEFEGGVVIVSHDFRLISQVAEELWEVADKTIRNLTKEDISIVDYKKNLVKHSTYIFFFSSDRVLIMIHAGEAQLEKAKLISKTTSKGKT